MIYFRPGNYRRGGTVCHHGWLLVGRSDGQIHVRCAFCSAAFLFDAPVENLNQSKPDF